MALRASGLVVPVAGGRRVAVDDVGDPEGVPVVYLHGTPDSRGSRHPDDALASAAGVRLLALDRPGYGGTSPLPGGAGDPDWPAVVATDVAAVLDAVGAERAAVLAWSGGALAGLAAAAASGAGGPLGGRVTALSIVGGLAPADAYVDPDVVAAAPGRHALVEMGEVVPAGELGGEVAPLLVPFPCDPALAAEHQAAGRTPGDAVELRTVAGAAEALALALAEAVRDGLAGVAADVEAQARPLPFDLAGVPCPVRLWYGTADDVAPAAFGRWLARHLPAAELTTVPGAGHYLLLTRWRALLAASAAG
ncbi:MAG TPA: alpha/beta hydrolase [Acidimicrobiales bacterium]|nr:alpha/beta hydrolase [Acidimicrobiales bacterium]